MTQNRMDALLLELELDAVIVSDEYNIRYLSGYSGGTGYLFISKNIKCILTDFRYTIWAKEQSIGYDVIQIENGYLDKLNELVQLEKVNRLGFEAKNISYSQYIEFEDRLKKTELVPLGDEIHNLRAIKTELELGYIRKAEAIGDKAYSQILNEIKKGMTEIEVAAKLEYLLKKNGAESLSFDVVAASGVNSAKPHAIPTHKKLEDGDFLTLDFGCRYQGYCSDMTRTIVIGKASERQKEIYNTVLKAQLAALDFIRAGYPGKVVDKVARDIIDLAGFEGCFGHGLGHSVGLYIHEKPSLSPKEEGIIRTNMIETVEPGIYVAGFGGVRIEDLVVVTAEGCINYSSSPKDLIEL